MLDLKPADPPFRSSMSPVTPDEFVQDLMRHDILLEPQIGPENNLMIACPLAYDVRTRFDLEHDIPSYRLEWRHKPRALLHMLPIVPVHAWRLDSDGSAGDTGRVSAGEKKAGQAKPDSTHRRSRRNTLPHSG